MAWALIKEVAGILGISEQAFCEAYRANARCRVTSAGSEILLSSLPTNVQKRFHAVYPQEALPEECSSDVDALNTVEKGVVTSYTLVEQPNELPQAMTNVVVPEVTALHVEVAKTYLKAPIYSRKMADKYSPLLDACEGLGGKKLQAFVDEWNQAHPDKKTSYKSIMRMRKEIEWAGADALFGKYGKNRGKTTVPDEPYKFFKALWMTDHRPANIKCWEETYGWARDNGYDMTTFPKLGAFMHRLKNDVPLGARHLARFGPESYNRKFGSKVDRDYDNVRAGECWVGDHTKADVTVLDTLSNTLVRPEVTVWRDKKSGYWFPCDVHTEPSSSYHIFKAFRAAAIELHYSVPSILMTDNGKDFTANDFTGGKKNSKHAIFIEEERLSLTAKLGIQVIRATPYHGQSKALERDFRIFEEQLVKNFSGYTGNNTVNKPESWKKDVASGNLKTLDEFKAFVEDYRINVMNRRIISSGYREGKSPLEIMLEEVQEAGRLGLIKKVTDEQLKLLCYRTSRVMAIRRNCIWDSECNVGYYSDRILRDVGRKVYLRRDYDEMDKADVHDAITHEFLYEVHLQKKPAALAKTGNQKKILKERLAENRRTEKLVRMMADPGMNISAEVRLSAMKSFIKSQEKESVADTDLSTIDINAPQIVTSENSIIATKAKQITEVIDYPELSDFDVSVSMVLPKRSSVSKLSVWGDEQELLEDVG